MRSRRVTILDIQALADNGLSGEEEKRVRNFIRHNLKARQYYGELLHQKQLLQTWWKEGQDH